MTLPLEKKDFFGLVALFLTILNCLTDPSTLQSSHFQGHPWQGLRFAPRRQGRARQLDRTRWKRLRLDLQRLNEARSRWN